MAMKRNLTLTQEFDSVSDAAEAESASVHGVVASVSTMNKGKRAELLEAKLTDGEQQLRVVGFQGTQRQKLASFEEKCKSVSLQNCHVKQACRFEELDIVLKSSSRVEGSPNRFSVGDISKIVSPEITLDRLAAKNIYDRVSFDAKVIHIEDPVKVSGGITKQDVTIADSTFAAKISLWEDDIGLVTDKSYRYTNVVVHVYQLSKYLSKPKEGCHRSGNR